LTRFDYGGVVGITYVSVPAHLVAAFYLENSSVIIRGVIIAVLRRAIYWFSIRTQLYTFYRMCMVRAEYRLIMYFIIENVVKLETVRYAVLSDQVSNPALQN
jgi:hypothetical protein